MGGQSFAPSAASGRHVRTRRCAVGVVFSPHIDDDLPLCALVHGHYRDAANWLRCRAGGEAVFRHGNFGGLVGRAGRFLHDILVFHLERCRQPAGQVGAGPIYLDITALVGGVCRDVPTGIHIGRGVHGACIDGIRGVDRV